MKRAIVLTALMFIGLVFWSGVAVRCVAQAPEETVTVPKSSLTDQQKAALVQRDMQSRVDQYGKWVGLGDEVGKAVNSGLSAITVQANNFAQTPVGKWTMFVIIFKVVGEKAVQYTVGFSMFIFGIPIWIWSYRKYLPKKYVVAINYDKDTGKKTSVEYDYGYGNRESRYSGNSLDSDQATAWCISHWVAFAIYFGVACIVMFAGS